MDRRDEGASTRSSRVSVDVVVLGAGASGLLCAMEAARRGRSVVVVEHTRRIGTKIGVSGGGRCNFTNLVVSRDHYLSENPHFATSALVRYPPSRFIALIDRHGIGYEVRDGGQLFCTGSARQIVDMLTGECERFGARFLLDSRVLGVQKGERFAVATTRGDFEAASLVVATGGLAAPQLGATPLGYALARQFHIQVTPLRPALTPLIWSRPDAKRFAALSGVSFHAAVRYGNASFRGQVLFTHRGLSGPAILQISSHWDGRGPIEVDLLPGIDIRAVFAENQRSKAHLSTLLSRFLPSRLARFWCEGQGESGPIHQVSPRGLDALAARLHCWELRPSGTEGFNKAEVTAGGVSTRELSSKTMEARKVPGLYFTGEVLDVTGQLGGYNLHWAWASGHAAGQVV